MKLIKRFLAWFKTPTPAYLEIGKAVKEHYEEQDKLNIRAFGHGYQPNKGSSSHTCNCIYCPKKYFKDEEVDSLPTLDILPPKKP